MLMNAAGASPLLNWNVVQQGALVRGTFQEAYYAQVLSLEDYDVEAAVGKPVDTSSRVSKLLPSAASVKPHSLNLKWSSSCLSTLCLESYERLGLPCLLWQPTGIHAGGV